MNFEPLKNANYGATVVALDHFNELTAHAPSGKMACDNVKAAIIFNYSVIVAKDTEPGAVGLFFPAETALSAKFLAENNLFRKTEFGNVDPSKTGFFEQHGRVKTMKFRGHPSEGFWIPLESLAYLGIPLSEFPVGTEFDQVNGEPICSKYIPKRNRVSNPCQQRGRKARVEDRIQDGQFRFHIDTAQFRRNTHRLDPDTIISISEKWHGTSAIFSNILVQKRGLAERLKPLFTNDFLVRRLHPKVNSFIYTKGTALVDFLTKIERKIGVFFGADEIPTEYGFTWASRRVIKGLDGVAKKNAVHYYSTDIWGTVAAEVQSLVPKGFTLYGEIVGYTTDGRAIQGGYHYGCQPGQHKFLIYRITSTNADGLVLELGWQQMKEFCSKYGLTMVNELYYGRAGDYGSPALRAYSKHDVDVWRDCFLNEVEQQYVSPTGMCQYNDFKVPLEGIVIRFERYAECESYKLKSFLFLKHESDELDKGVLDMETEQSEVEPEAEVTE